MHTSRAAGGDHDALRARDLDLSGFHIQKHRAGRLAGFVENQLDRRREIHDRNTAIKHLVAQRAHDFRAGIVRRRMHTLCWRFRRRGW